jgi:transglutaminase-like putative cysteine protease
MSRRGVVVAVLLLAAAGAVRAEQKALYRAGGADAGLFDQYDNDGYSLAVTAAADGTLDLAVRVSDAPLASAAPFPTGLPPDPTLAPAPERDTFARKLVAGSRTEADAVRRILLALAGEIAYDPDRLRLQDPAAVFSSRRAYCVGYAELAVDLLRRVAIPARTVQGILVCGPGHDGFDAHVGGAYHRWIEVYYPDRGNVCSLAITAVSASGELGYQSVHSGSATVRVRE